MIAPAPKPRYVIVSPVKDEERYVALTLESVVSQTVTPAAWVIVDDGSTDRTGAIVGDYVRRHPFIRLVTRVGASARQPGPRVIHAFNAGYQSLVDEDYDFIVKLDCDLSFGPRYFEELLDRFKADSSLGIASGVYLEADSSGEWKPVIMPSYHAFGACKVVRRTCFDAIGAFIAAKGWDTVDEIRAMHRGWKTRHFEELQTRHHKPEGSGIGVLKTSKMHGEIYYVTGGDPLFFILKCLRRVPATPFLVSALALAVGYGSAWISRKPMLVTAEEARRYRQLLRRRLLSVVPRSAVAQPRSAAD